MGNWNGSISKENIKKGRNNESHHSFPANDTGAKKDLGATNTYRYVTATNVYNKGKSDGVTTHTATYTFGSGDTGGTKDLGVNHTYRYVNASNVYNKGKSDVPINDGELDYIFIGASSYILVIDCIRGEAIYGGMMGEATRPNGDRLKWEYTSSGGGYNQGTFWSGRVWAVSNNCEMYGKQGSVLQWASFSHLHATSMDTSIATGGNQTTSDFVGIKVNR